MDYLTNRLKGNKRAWLKRQQWRNRSSSNRKGVSEEEIEGYVPKLKTMTEEKNTNRFFFPARKVKVFYRTKMDETWEEREVRTMPLALSNSEAPSSNCNKVQKNELWFCQTTVKSLLRLPAWKLRGSRKRKRLCFCLAVCSCAVIPIYQSAYCKQN